MINFHGYRFLIIVLRFGLVIKIWISIYDFSSPKHCSPILYFYVSQTLETWGFINFEDMLNYK